MRNAMSSSSDGDSRAVSDLGALHLLEARNGIARPRRLDLRNERAPLRHGFQMALSRRLQGNSKLSSLAQGGIVAGRRRAPGSRQQDQIIGDRAEGHQIDDPGFQRRTIFDPAPFGCPLETMAEGKSAHRKCR